MKNTLTIILILLVQLCFAQTFTETVKKKLNDVDTKLGAYINKPKTVRTYTIPDSIYQKMKNDNKEAYVFSNNKLVILKGRTSTHRIYFLLPRYVDYYNQLLEYTGVCIETVKENMNKVSSDYTYPLIIK